VSEPPPETPAPAPLPEGTIRCARCGTNVPPDADWCLECGLAARTRIAPTPRWKIPVAILGVLVALALAGLAVAFVDLTKDPEPAAAPATTAAPTVPPTAPPTTPPVVTAPPATTTTPPATAPTTPTTTPTTAPEGGAVAPPETTPSTATVPPSAAGEDADGTSPD
jgi:hypothetical protein